MTVACWDKQQHLTLMPLVSGTNNNKTPRNEAVMATKKPAATTAPEHYEDLEELPPVEPTVEPTALTYATQDGDTWASISDTHRPAGTTKHLYAEYLLALNGGTLTTGRTINL